MNAFEGKIVVNFHIAERNEQGDMVLVPDSGLIATVVADGTAGEAWQEDFAIDRRTGDRYFVSELELGKHATESLVSSAGV